MKCKNCGKELPEEADFCMKCGAPQKPELRRALAHKLGLQWLVLCSISFGTFALVALLSSIFNSRGVPWSDPWLYASFLAVFVLMVIPSLLLWRSLKR
jgi:nicotinamide riboside transporter PnuC